VILRDRHLSTDLHRRDLGAIRIARGKSSESASRSSGEEKAANRKEHLSIAGSLMYAAPGSRPDIAFSATGLNRCNVQPARDASDGCGESPTISQDNLRSSYSLSPSSLFTPFLCCPHPSFSHLSAIGYTDSDLAGNLTARKSVGRCVFGLGYVDSSLELITSGSIHLPTRAQSAVVTSTLEAEYIACSHAKRESLWLKRILKDAADGMSTKASDGPVPIGCDNQGAIKSTTSGVVRQKSKVRAAAAGKEKGKAAVADEDVDHGR